MNGSCSGLVVPCLSQRCTKTFYPAIALAIWNQFGIDVSYLEPAYARNKSKSFSLIKSMGAYSSIYGMKAQIEQGCIQTEYIHCPLMFPFSSLAFCERVAPLESSVQPIGNWVMEEQSADKRKQNGSTSCFCQQHFWLPTCFPPQPPQPCCAAPWLALPYICRCRCSKNPRSRDLSYNNFLVHFYFRICKEIFIFYTLQRSLRGPKGIINNALLLQHLKRTLNF